MLIPYKRLRARLCPALNPKRHLCAWEYQSYQCHEYYPLMSCEALFPKILITFLKLPAAAVCSLPQAPSTNTKRAAYSLSYCRGLAPAIAIHTDTALPRAALLAAVDAGAADQPRRRTRCCPTHFSSTFGAPVSNESACAPVRRACLYQPISALLAPLCLLHPALLASVSSFLKPLM